MNQQLFPGVGNYIKSESLYKTNIHPEESWGLISDENKKKLITNTKIVMNQKAIKMGLELKKILKIHLKIQIISYKFMAKKSYRKHKSIQN